MTFDNTSAAGVGICITLLCLFAELMLPDRLLAEFTDDYLVLFNTRERDSCSLIYWDEIVNWQYEYHSYADTLVILLEEKRCPVAQSVYSRQGNKEYPREQGRRIAYD